MNEPERKAKISFVEVINNFLGNRIAESYATLVNKMLIGFRNIGYNMSIKAHCLQSNLNFFQEDYGATSERKDEIFQQ